VRSLPASWYHDANIYQQERQRIFARNWSVLGRAEQLNHPGDFISGEIAGWPVFVVCGEDRVFRGFHNVCRHRAGPVVLEACGNRHKLRCPYHGWVYGLDGRLTHSPGFENSGSVSAESSSLVAIAVAEWNSLVFARVKPGSESLHEWLGDIVDIAQGFPAVADMSFFDTATNRGDVNWKAYSDNAAEGYHLGSIHKELFASIHPERTEIKAYSNGKFVGFNMVYKATPSQPQSNGFWIYKYPGLLLHFSDTGFNVEKVTPRGPRECAMQRWFWFTAAVEPAGRRQAVEFSTRVMTEDLAICLRVQQNLEAGVYETGQLSKDRESGTIFFQQCVREALAGNS